MPPKYELTIYPGSDPAERPYGDYIGQWNLVIQQDGELLYSFELLTPSSRQGVLHDNWANGDYILDLDKYDDKGQAQRLESKDLNLINDLLTQAHRWELPVYNKYHQEMGLYYVQAVGDFLMPRLPIAITQYQEQENTVFSHHIEPHLDPPRDFRPLPRS